MAAGPTFAKQRFLWQPAAWRLLREAACADYARQAAPAVVDGIHILFPETTVSRGLRVTVTTAALAGESLLAMLYQPAQQESALAVGLAALEAWQRAAITGRPFRLFSLVFRLFKGPRALLRGWRGPDRMPSGQRQELRRLVLHYMRPQKGSRCLVHGDLHASHLVVNLAQPSLGFIDLEAMHVGKAATNFAQLWVGYHYADPALGRAFYQAYRSRFPGVLTPHFDADVRAELALRCQTHVRQGLRTGNQELAARARGVLAAVLAGPSFETLCLEDKLH